MILKHFISVHKTDFKLKKTSDNISEKSQFPGQLTVCNDRKELIVKEIAKSPIFFFRIGYLILLYQISLPSSYSSYIIKGI